MKFAFAFIFLLVGLTNCRSKPVESEQKPLPVINASDEPAEIKPGIQKHAQQNTTVHDLSRQAQEAELKVISRPSEHTTASNGEPIQVTAAAASDHGGHKPAGRGVSPEQSLKWLLNGNTRFIKGQFRADGRKATDRTRLAKGQQPHAIVLSCSDSRVPPEHVFDQALGEIFVVRTAGESLGDSVIASIEYAVEHLGARLVLVMGHTSCGAVNLALDTKDGVSSGSSAVDGLIADIKPRLKTVATEPRSPGLGVESALNADGVARDLIRRSEVLRKRAESGEIKIKSALYHLQTGKVSIY